LSSQHNLALDYRKPTDEKIKLIQENIPKINVVYPSLKIVFKKLADILEKELNDSTKEKIGDIVEKTDELEKSVQEILKPPPVPSSPDSGSDSKINAIMQELNKNKSYADQEGKFTITKEDSTFTIKPT
jgi:benzoyl-CoA reductase/2-hydroxyglutaryl-CoA dehydratase subunit BcrC/BadD/HgdB